MAMNMIYIWFFFMAGVLGFVVFAEICWWIFLGLFKLLDDYLHG
jgi:hypothetical protein